MDPTAEDGPADLATAAAVDLAATVAARQASPLEIVEALLARIDAWEPRLNAFVVLDREGSIAQARAATDAVVRGEPLGPLHGVPVTIKDVQAVAGFPTRRGSRLTDPRPAPNDAPLVARLRRAGAIVLGITTTPEHGWTAVGDSPLSGSTHNPWGAGLTAGGSSAGAAALAGSGCGPLHLGTDGAGSIRLPAHFCGAVGFKPTFGTVPYVPVPSNGSLSHAGPLARTVADAALMTAVMAGPDARDHTSLPGTFDAVVGTTDLRGLRIAYSPDLGHARVDSDVASLVAEAVLAFEDAGALVSTVTPAWGPSGPELARELWGAAYVGYLPADDEAAAQMDPGLVAYTRAFAGLTANQVLDAQRWRLDYAATVNSWFGDQGWDLLVTPTASVPAFESGRQVPDDWDPPGGDGSAPDWLAWAEFTYPFNLSHGPAISVPCGLTADGLPVGLQIAGPRLADGLVLRAAAAFLQHRPFTARPVA